MKSIVKIIAASAVSALLLCSCGKGKETDKTAAELLSAAKDSGAKFEELVSVDGTDIKYTYDLDESLYDDFAAEAAGNPAYADEIVFVKASSDENVDKVKKAIEARVESRKKTLESYAPDEFDKLCSSKVMTNGKYVYLIVGSSAGDAQKAVEKAF